MMTNQVSAGKVKFVLAVKPAGCSYCDAAKKFISNQGFEYDTLNIQDKDDYEAVHDLFLATNQTMMRTVPMIFVVGVDGKYDLVGGFDDLNDKWDDLVLEHTAEFVNKK